MTILHKLTHRLTTRTYAYTAQTHPPTDHINLPRLYCTLSATINTTKHVFCKDKIISFNINNLEQSCSMECYIKVTPHWGRGQYKINHQIKTNQGHIYTVCVATIQPDKGNTLQHFQSPSFNKYLTHLLRVLILTSCTLGHIKFNKV